MNLNINLAWRRVQRDIQYKHFVKPIALPEGLQKNENSWLKTLQNELECGRYKPKTMEVIEVPKGKGLVRQGSLLSIEDNIAYSAVVMAAYPQIHKQIAWSQNNVDFAYIASKENIKSLYWYKNQYLGWKAFRENNLQKMSSYSYVVFTDITAFYDNIKIGTLVNDLLNCGVNKEIADQVNKFLNRWAQASGQGIPQNNSASDLLAKLYLNEVDQVLNNAGFAHHRYVDDIRVFCRSKKEAKEVLIILSRLLRSRGLNLQSAKTKILNTKDAIIETIGVQSVIGMISEELQDDYFSDEPAYNNSEQQSSIYHAIPVEIIRQTFKANFIDVTDNFDKTLFHFLINRLIKIKDSYALDFCMSNLEKHPEETAFFLKYSDSFGKSQAAELNNQMKKSLVKFLLSNKAVYAYQNYQIFNWLFQKGFMGQHLYSLLFKRINFDSSYPFFSQYFNANKIEIHSTQKTNKMPFQLTQANKNINNKTL